MTASDIDFIKMALTSIENHLILINGRCMEHAGKITVLETNQQILMESKKDMKAAFLQIAASVAAVIVSYLVGKYA